MALDAGAAVAGSMSGMHCALVDTRATKPDAVIWGHNYGTVVNSDPEDSSTKARGSSPRCLR
jgi:hypothetical protein